jgi:hypothetical protein
MVWNAHGGIESRTKGGGEGLSQKMLLVVTWKSGLFYYFTVLVHTYFPEIRSHRTPCSLSSFHLDEKTCLLQEVDEENLVETEAEAPGITAAAESKSESDLKAKFELFYRSITANSESSAPRRCPPPTVLPPSHLAKREEDGGSALRPSPETPSASHLNQALQFEGQTIDEDPMSPSTSRTTAPKSSPAPTSDPLPIPFNPRSRPSL